MKTKLMLICLSGLILTGCVGSPVRNSIVYNSKQGTIARNNRHLLGLAIGQSRAEVNQIMGAPERSEGYAWGTVWLYRTAMTSGIYGTADADFTPVVFDYEGKLSGWGRNYYAAHVNKTRLEIEQVTPANQSP
jgi:Protein of unknown function (DUF3192)